MDSAHSPRKRDEVWQLFKGIMREAGIAADPHATPRGLGIASACTRSARGVPLNLVQRWLGRASMHTTAIYLQAVGDEEREIAAQMWGNSIL